MTLTLYKYDALGRPLTKEEVDGNWTEIENVVNDALSGALPVAAITLVEDATGQFLRFLDGEGAALASVPFPAMLAESGDWESLVDYTTRHIVTHLGGTYLCRVAHTAAAFETDLLAGRWTQLGSTGGASIAFDPGSTGLDAVTVQEAIVELAFKIGDGLTADRVDYDNAASGLTGTNVQAAVDQLAARPVVDTAAQVSVEPAGSVSATDVQAALVELATRLDGAVTDVSADDVSVAPITGINGSTVQAVLENLKTRIDAIEPVEGGSGDGSAVSTSFDSTGLEAVTTATDVQHAIADVVGALASSGSGPLTAEDIGYSGGGWNIGGLTVQAAIVQIGDQLQALDGAVYEVPAGRVKLDPDYMVPYYWSNELPNALNQIAQTLETVLANLQDHSTRLAALESA